MRQRQQKRARGFLSRGALISLLLHVNIFGPIILAAWIYGGEEEAQRNAEVDVAFEDGATANLPEDLPPIETPPEALDAQKPEKQKPDPRKKKIEVAKQEPAKKEADKTAGENASCETAIAALYEAALGHMRSGRYLDAQLCCE